MRREGPSYTVDTLAELAREMSDNVDVIYVATPHPYHYENTLMCLNAGKHVLVEKPFAMNARQAGEMIALARQKGLFLMDFWI